MKVLSDSSLAAEILLYDPTGCSSQIACCCQPPEGRKCRISRTSDDSNAPEDDECDHKNVRYVHGKWTATAMRNVNLQIGWIDL